MEKKKGKTISTRKGFVIPLAVIVIVILLLVGNGVLALGFYSRLKSVQSTSDIYARAAADAGLTLAMYKMNQKLAAEMIWDNSTLSALNAKGVTLPNSDAKFSYTITGDPASGFTIRSRGTYGRAKRTIDATTRIKSLFDLAVAVKKDLELYPNTSVLGYDSASGTKGQKIQIGTHCDSDDSVIVMNGATVDGDVFVGVDGNPADVIKSGGVITGDSYPLPQRMDFPEPVVPAGLVPRGNINNSVSITAGASGKYSFISLGNTEVITVEGGGQVIMHITGDIRMGNGSEINVKPGTSLVMYVDGDWESKEGAGVNNENGIPENFKVYGTNSDQQNLDIKAKNEFFGVVYAPNATVEIKANGDIYGAFTSENFAMKSKSILSYDVNLKKVGINDDDARFRVRSWREH
ncbi:MAG: DUF7305 domain-containing protein [Planctomycetota bacterium]|jgi:hypothetical protein